MAPAPANGRACGRARAFHARRGSPHHDGRSPTASAECGSMILVMGKRVSVWSLVVVLVLLGGMPRLEAQKPLHLVLTPSQKPTDLLATGQEFAEKLGKLVDMPVRVTVAADYAAVVEALRNETADLAFAHPVGYVLANREAKAVIALRNRWHGKTTFTSRIYVRKDSGLASLEALRGRTIAFIDPASSSGYIYPMVLLMQRGLVQ